MDNIFTSILNKQEEELKRIDELIQQTEPVCDLATGKKVHQEILGIITDIYERNFIYNVMTVMKREGIVEVSYDYTFYQNGKLVAKTFIASAKGGLKNE